MIFSTRETASRQRLPFREFTDLNNSTGAGGTMGFERISMHGVRRELLLRQAEAIGLPLDREISVRTGETLRRDSFLFCDLLPN